MGETFSGVQVGDPVHLEGEPNAWNVWKPGEGRPATHVVAELGPNGVPCRFDPLPTEPKKRRRGFAAMDREFVREIAKKGGRAAHVAGTAHEFTSDEAREAGRRGGLATHRKLREARGERAKG